MAMDSDQLTVAAIVCSVCRNEGDGLFVKQERGYWLCIECLEDGYGNTGPEEFYEIPF